MLGRTVKGYTVKEYIRNWIIIAVATMVAVVVFSSRNSITGDFDLSVGIGTLGDVFGGLPVLGTFLFIIAAIVAVVLLLLHMTNRTYKKGEGGVQTLHIALIVGVIGLALIVGGSWIKFDEDFWPTIGTFLLSIAFISLVTALVTRRIKSAPIATVRP